MNEEQLENFRQHVMTALKAIPSSRWYALDSDRLDALAYLGVAWFQDRLDRDLRFSAPEFEKFMSEVVTAIPSLRRERPGDPATLPQPWLHPITKAPLPPPKSPDERGVLAKRDPQLLALMERLEKMPYQVIAELADAEARRLRLVSITYDQSTHTVAANPFLTDDIEAQGRFVRQQGEEVADVYRKEAATPIELPWMAGENNLSALGDLTTKAPVVAKLGLRATELQRQRAAQQLEDAKAAETTARSERQKAERLLQGQRA